MGVHSQPLNENKDEQWHDAQHDELGWWGDCANTFWEETKQIEYAKLMDIKFEYDEHGPYFIDLHGRSVLDIGGGPVSLLLKASKGSGRTVVDPCEYPSWVAERYRARGIEYLQLMGEQVNKLASAGQPQYDEVWMYNVLQHTDDPQKIIQNIVLVLKPGGKLRFFDWIDTDTNVAHPHTLTAEQLIGWLKESGLRLEDPSKPTVTKMDTKGCYGPAFAGVFING